MFRGFGWLLFSRWCWRCYRYETLWSATQFTILFRWVPSVFSKGLCRDGMKHILVELYVQDLLFFRKKFFSDCRLAVVLGTFNDQIRSGLATVNIEWLPTSCSFYWLHRSILGISTVKCFLLGSYVSGFYLSLCLTDILIFNRLQLQGC